MAWSGYAPVIVCLICVLLRSFKNNEDDSTCEINHVNGCIFSLTHSVEGEKIRKGVEIIFLIIFQASRYSVVVVEKQKQQF